MKIAFLLLCSTLATAAAAQVEILPTGEPVFDEVEQSAEFPGGLLGCPLAQNVPKNTEPRS